jgi:hypothetical protein
MQYVQQPSKGICVSSTYIIILTNTLQHNRHQLDPKESTHLAASRDSGAVGVARCALAETPARERLPEHALVGTRVAVDIGLDPGITGSDDCGKVSGKKQTYTRRVLLTGRVTGLEEERVEEEVEEDGVAGRAGRCGAGSSVEAVRGHECGVDVVEHVRPDLTDVCRTAPLARMSREGPN